MPEYLEMQYMSPELLKQHCRNIRLWVNVSEVIRLRDKWRLAVYLLSGGIDKRKATNSI